MRSKIEDWSNGWFGIELGIRRDEIDSLIELLKMIKNDPEQHFHLSSNYEGAGGLGDIEIYIQSPEEEDNMTTFGSALSPGDEIPDPE